MSRILVVAKQNRDNEGLCSSLNNSNYDCSLTPDNEKISEKLAQNPPDLVIIDSNDPSRLKQLSRLIKQDKNHPVIALLEADMLEAGHSSPQLSLRAHPDEVGSRSADSILHTASRMNVGNRDNPGRGFLPIDLDRIDDFLVKPLRLSELEIRIKKLLRRESPDSSEQIKRGDMVIDLAKCEVTVAGRPILLTFKEYQLLKFLASNRGRVFSRDALLNKVWGYEYYGGDRTVDVHIKRLRSKIEDANHAFIETVRNIGYRLKVD